MFFYICICICIIMYLSYSNICLFIIDFFTTHCKLTLSLVTLNSVRSSWTGCPRGCDERSCDLPWRQRCFQHPIYHGRLWGYEEVKSPIFPLYDNHYQSFKSLFKSYPFARTTRGNIRQMIEDQGWMGLLRQLWRRTKHGHYKSLVWENGLPQCHRQAGVLKSKKDFAARPWWGSMIIVQRLLSQVSEGEDHKRHGCNSSDK